MDLAQLSTGTVDTIRDQLPALTIDELRALHAVEKAGKNRVTLIEAIEERIGEIVNATTPPSEPPLSIDTAATAAPVAAWLAPDYTGPLDIAQAEARNRILAAQSAG